MMLLLFLLEFELEFFLRLGMLNLGDCGTAGTLGRLNFTLASASASAAACTAATKAHAAVTITKRRVFGILRPSLLQVAKWHNF